MKLLEQCAIVIAICLASIIISQYVPFTLPVSIVSMVLLFILLCTHRIKEHHIQEIGDYLLKNMAFFFIPAGVGILEYFELLKGQALILLLICLITTLITFAATALTVHVVMKLTKRGENYE